MDPFKDNERVSATVEKVEPRNKKPPGRSDVKSRKAVVVTLTIPMQGKLASRIPKRFHEMVDAHTADGDVSEVKLVEEPSEKVISLFTAGDQRGKPIASATGLANIKSIVHGDDGKNLRVVIECKYGEAILLAFADRLKEEINISLDNAQVEMFPDPNPTPTQR